MSTRIGYALIEIKHAEPAGMSRLGQDTDILRTRTDVRFTPESGHVDRHICPASANHGGAGGS